MGIVTSQLKNAWYLWSCYVRTLFIPLLARGGKRGNISTRHVTSTAFESCVSTLSTPLSRLDISTSTFPCHVRSQGDTRIAGLCDRWSRSNPRLCRRSSDWHVSDRQWSSHCTVNTREQRDPVRQQETQKHQRKQRGVA